MTISPTLAEFKRLAKTFNLIPVCADTTVDRLTPVAVYEQLSQGEKYAFLLESVEGGERFGRYSFVGRRPHAVFQCKGDRVTMRRGTQTNSYVSQNPFKDLKELFENYKPAMLPQLPRFWGGAVGFWDYESVRYFERLPDSQPDLLGAPTGAFQITGELVVLDRFLQRAQVVSTVHVSPSDSSDRALESLYRKSILSVRRLIADLHQPVKSKPVKKTGKVPVFKPMVKAAAYCTAVEKAKEHIRAGDIIQVVLSQRWVAKATESPFNVYRALRLVNPSPYMYLLHFPEVDIVGSSPELLVRKDQFEAETRPIAGTRPRGLSEAQDRQLADELIADPKERAEHLMLVDLGRNDLGRVCEPGSVSVPELMKIENYSHVMHLVSSVKGKLSKTANAFDLFQACFPAGTVSGAPKIRAMEIIDELETFKRGPYAGAVGYFSFNGNMDMAITIRTLVFCQGNIILQAGAGIVADSIPEKELQECEHKAAALMAALKKVRDLE